MVTHYPRSVEQQMQRYYRSLSEKDRRRYAGIEALKLGRGGIRYIGELLNCDYRTIKAGMTDLRDESAMQASGIRRAGGGRKSAFETVDKLDETFLRVVSPHTAGSPMDERIKWTNLSRPKIAELMSADGVTVSVTVVDKLLKKYNYRRRRARKTLATGSHPERNEQFEKIESLREQYQSEGNPVLSMDTKKES